MAFGKRENKEFDIIIGLSSKIVGDLSSEGSIRIDGKVDGDIKSSGDVIIGDHAEVNADIEAEYCEISGKVSGSIHTETQLKIFKSGQLDGDITVSSFTIEEGGIFSGNCIINPDKKERKSASDKSKKHDKKEQNNKNEHNNKQHDNKNNQQNKQKTS